MHYRKAYTVSQLLGVPGIVRVDFDKVGEEDRASVQWTALDPLWKNDERQSGLIVPLREHITRLYSITAEVGESIESRWSAVAANLHLAASLSDLFADTDITGSSIWCGHAADYEDVNSELAAKHLAGVIVFTLVWTAYEAAVEIATGSGSQHGRGAAGREMLLQFPSNWNFPLLKESFFEASGCCTRCGIEISGAHVRRCLQLTSTPALAAEHLRQFRNLLIHGRLLKPEPGDWGKHSKYVVDEDPFVRQFEANSRLALILIQILMRHASTWEPFDPACSSGIKFPECLWTLHCEVPEDGELLFNDMMSEEGWYY